MNRLFESSKTGNVRELKELLKTNIDLNIEDEDGTTPLCIVAKCRPDLVRMF
jgi:hypothetical protein